MTAAAPQTESQLPSGGSFSRAVWVEFPVWLSGYVPSTASAFTDGQHLLRWNRVAGVAPILAFVIGVVTEFLQVDEVFTTSLFVVVVLSSVGLLSVQLGAWSVVGYVTADLLSGRQVGRSFGRKAPEIVPEWLEWTAGWVSASTEYLLLLIAVVGVPALVLSVRLMVRTSGLYSTIGVVGERLVHVLAVVVGFYVWCQLVVTSIRTVYTVRNVSPTEEAVFTAQRQWPIIVTVLAVVAVLRFMIEKSARYDGAVGVVVETTKRFQDRKPEPPVWWRGLPARTIVGLLLLGGLIEFWWQVPVTVAVYVFVGVSRKLLGETWLARWLGKFPLLARVAVAVVASFLIISRVIAQVLDRSSLFDFSARDSFVMPWVGVIVSLLVVGLLTITPARTDTTDRRGGAQRPPQPPQPPAPPNNRRVPDPSTSPIPQTQQTPPPPPPPPTRRGWLSVGAVLVFVSVLFQASPVAADNCSGFSDCAGTQQAWLIFGLVLLAVVFAVVFWPVLAPAAGFTVAAGAVTIGAAEFATIAVASGMIWHGLDLPVPNAPDINLPDFSTVNASGTEPASLGDDWIPLDIDDDSCWTGCEDVAEEIQEVVGGEIVTIKPGEGEWLGPYRDSEARWGHHDVVVEDGRVYDGFGPPDGIPVEEYKELWEYADGINWPF